MYSQVEVEIGAVVGSGAAVGSRSSGVVVVAGFVRLTVAHFS